VPIYFVDKPGSAAVEEIISLGMPKGSSRMTSVAIRDPVEPPMAMTPLIFPALYKSLAILVAPLIMILVMDDRSRDVLICSRELPPAHATSEGVSSALDFSFPLIERSINRGRTSISLNLYFRYRVSSLFVSRVEMINTDFLLVIVPYLYVVCRLQKNCSR